MQAPLTATAPLPAVVPLHNSDLPPGSDRRLIRDLLAAATDNDRYEVAAFGEHLTLRNTTANRSLLSLNITFAPARLVPLHALFSAETGPVRIEATEQHVAVVGRHGRTVIRFDRTDPATAADLHLGGVYSQQARDLYVALLAAHIEADPTTAAATVARVAAAEGTTGLYRKALDHLGPDALTDAIERTIARTR